MRRKYRNPSFASSVGKKTVEQLVTLGILFMAVPYVYSKLRPLRDKMYGNPVIPPVIGGGSILQTEVPLTVSPLGLSPVETISALANAGNNELAPTGQAPLTESNPNDLSPSQGLFGGLFIE